MEMEQPTEQIMECLLTKMKAEMKEEIRSKKK
jgi:hypothetical protein